MSTGWTGVSASLHSATGNARCGLPRGTVGSERAARSDAVAARADLPLEVSHCVTFPSWAVRIGRVLPDDGPDCAQTAAATSCGELLRHHADQGRRQLSNNPVTHARVWVIQWRRTCSLAYAPWAFRAASRTCLRPSGTSRRRGRLGLRVRGGAALLVHSCAPHCSIWGLVRISRCRSRQCAISHYR